MGVEPVFVRALPVIGLRGDINNDGFFLADTFPAVIDHFWDLDKEGIVITDEELVDLTAGG